MKNKNKENKNKELKLSAIDWIYIVGFVVFLFIVVKHGGVSSTPSYFIFIYIALFWLVELWKAGHDIVSILRDELQTTPRDNVLRRIGWRGFLWLVPLLLKASITGSILWRLKILSQLEELST